jgi:prolyl-tRNA editing enzyme YbaK/EbsC (Cys-tRNA(Pro) deacylase)
MTAGASSTIPSPISTAIQTTCREFATEPVLCTSAVKPAAASRSPRTATATPMRAAFHVTAEDGRVIETLELAPALTRPDLLAAPVLAALRGWAGERPVERIAVAAIDPDVADTAAFAERYGVPLEESANCVVIAGKREGAQRQLACVVLATTRADVNGVARRRLDVRKASFMPMDEAVAGTGMEYGGITPIGLPPGWPVLVDSAVAAADRVVIGSGVRRSKLRLPGEVLAGLPGIEVVDGLGR